MTMKQICQLGFCCPYHRYNDEGYEMCTYPYITEEEDNRTFEFIKEIVCPLVLLDSELDNWLMEESEVKE